VDWSKRLVRPATQRRSAKAFPATVTAAVW
jgi:hypothetical protein